MEQNRKSDEAFAGQSLLSQQSRRFQKVFNNRERINYPNIVRDYTYNLWQGETKEGGHGAASTNNQEAEMWALMYTYLNSRLMHDQPSMAAVSVLPIHERVISLPKCSRKMR